MAHVDSINIHDADHVVAKPECSNGTSWVSVEFIDDYGKRRFRVSVFMDYDRASRVAQAINSAWPEPVAADDPVIDWPRPSYHKQAVGMRDQTNPFQDRSEVMRAAALNGDDTPPDGEAA